MRDERGAISLLEVTIASALLLVVLVPVLSQLTSAERVQRFGAEFSEDVAAAEVAVASLARRARGADALEDTGVPNVVRAWFDEDRDAVRDPGEIVEWAIVISPDRGPVLVEIDGGSSRILAQNLALAASALSISRPAGGGVLLVARVAIGTDTRGAPAPTVVETEVLARNA